MAKAKITSRERSLMNRILHHCIKLNEIQNEWSYEFEFGIIIKCHKWNESEGLNKVGGEDIFHSDIYTDLREQRLGEILEILKGDLKKYERSRYSK